MIKNGKIGHRVRINNHSNHVRGLKKWKRGHFGDVTHAFWPPDVETGTIVDIVDPSVKSKMYYVKPDSPGWGDFILTAKQLDWE